MDRLLQNNTFLKILSFLLAVMLWAVVGIENQANAPLSQGQTTLENIAIETVYDGDMFEVMNIDYELAQVLLSGQRSKVHLNALRTNFRLYVDLRDLEEGVHQVPIEHEGFDPDLQVDIYPRSVEVVIERIEAQLFPVEIEIEGDVMEAYTLGELSIAPDQVHVYAPTSILNQVASVRGSINIAEADELITQVVSLQAYDAEGNVVDAQLTPDEVEIQLPVISPSVVVPLHLELINELPDDLSLSSVEVNVTEVEVFAPLDILEGISEIVLTIDLSEVTSNEQLYLDIPLEEEWISISPAFIEVMIRVGATQERTFSNIPIEIIGLREGFALQFLEEENQVRMVVSGSRERLDRLSVDDIEAVIDVTQLGIGEHEVEVELQLPNYLAYQLLPDRRLSVRILSENEAEQTMGSEEEEKESVE